MLKTLMLDRLLAPLAYLAALESVVMIAARSCTHKSAGSAYTPTAAQKRTLREVCKGPEADLFRSSVSRVLVGATF